MERREFIKNIALGSVPFFIGKSLFAEGKKESNKITEITFLHTNDTHSRLDPFPDGSGGKSNMGGVSRRASLIKEIKKNSPNTYLFDAGDAFQGTPYYNFYSGKLEYQALSMLGYNYVTIGNHEFDSGTDKLLAAMEYSKFKIVSSNYTSELSGFKKHVSPYDIFEVNGVKFGVFGLSIPFKGLVGEDSHKGIVDLPIFETAKTMVAQLRKQVDFLILLSHIGIEIDEPLAEKISGIDLIIGGHSHTYLKKPFTPKNSDTMILQAGASGVYLGKLDLKFVGNSLVKTEYESIPVK
ncbi:metallophosphatase [bacterium]|nr:metallophosphatase [bacterium]